MTPINSYKTCWKTVSHEIRHLPNFYLAGFTTGKMISTSYKLNITERHYWLLHCITYQRATSHTLPRFFSLLQKQIMGVNCQAEKNEIRGRRRRIQRETEIESPETEWVGKKKEEKCGLRVPKRGRNALCMIFDETKSTRWR